MSRNSPSARRHRALVFLARLERYKRLGPLVGPRTPEQELAVWGPKGDPRWTKETLEEG